MVGAASLSLFLCVLCAQDACKVGLSCGRDEELGPDLTSRVDTLSQDKDSSVDSVLHGNDLALAVAEREVVVEEPPAELVGPHGLDGLRQDLAEGAGCEVSFCCFDGLAEGCDRALGFDFCFCLGACCSFLLEGCEEADSHVGVGDDGVDGGGCRVHAVLADGGQDLACYPTSECTSAFDLGTKDCVVQPAFRYYCQVLCSAKGTR